MEGQKQKEEREQKMKVRKKIPHRIKTGFSTRIYENYLRFPSPLEA
jgi:hypothetical protein